MNVLLPWLLVAVGVDAPIEGRYPEATEIFHCTFDKSWDENFNGWPDNWSRQRDPKHPPFVRIKIAEEPAPEGDRCLRIDMDGYSALAYSPPAKIGPLFSYVLEGYLKTERLKHARAYFSITLQNEKRQPLGTYFSEKVRQTDGWKKFRLGPISPENDDVRFARIGLHAEKGERPDLNGTVLFDDVWLGRLPRMALKTGDPYNFFTDPSKVEIHCTASGFYEQSPSIVFELEDVWGETLDRLERRLDTKPAGAAERLSLDSFSDDSPGLVGKATWKPAVPGPGFYRVRVTMKGQTMLVHQRELTLVVIEPQHSPAGGEFGWTLPRGNQPLPLPRLGQLIAQAGINWVKYPLWYDEQSSEEMIERLVAFGERLSLHGIELVGLLDEPPQSLRPQYGPSPPQSIVEVFTPSSEVWSPSLEPVMTRLATRVRWWQLGHDTDTSFVGYPNLAEKITQVKTELDRIGQDVNLGIGWGWINALPRAPDGETPWRSLTFSANPPMTHTELAAYLDTKQKTEFLRWIVVEPLAAGVYPVEVRAIDLVRRMIAAKIHGADAIFCPEPFSTERGLLNDDGTPGELFLPWRTTALVLSGAEFLGSIELPGGSPNQIFSRENEAMMIVWNQRPTEEVIYLGENVRQIDLWGRSAVPPKRDHRQVIRVGRLPTFVTGVNEPITRWRMGFEFSRKQIPSVFGRPHANSFTLKNTFARGLGGEAELIAPEVWNVRPTKFDFRLAGGEDSRQEFRISLPYYASGGRHKVRVDFLLNAERPYRFSIYRKIGIGLGDVEVEISTRLSEQGELEVNQQLINETDSRVSFRCHLFIPGRRRLKTEILGLGRGRDARVYHLPEGKRLIGKTLWLRAEEIAGPRVLNYRFVAKE